MTNRNTFLTLALLVLQSAAGAQSAPPEDVAVIQAVTEYYRDVRLKGVIVIDDATRPHGSREVGASTIAQVVATAAASRGRVDDYLSCTDQVAGGRKRRVCAMRGGAGAVITFSDLTIERDTATVDVMYKTVRGEHFHGGDDVVTLVKGQNGQWRVVRLEERGVS